MPKKYRRDQHGNEIKGGNPRNKDRYKFEYAGFIRSDMAKADRAAADKFLPSDDDMDSWLTKRTEAGFAVKIGIKSDGDGIVASLTCTDSEHDWHGYILSAFHDNWHDALRILMYKDTVMLAVGWELGMPGGDTVGWG